METSWKACDMNQGLREMRGCVNKVSRVRAFRAEKTNWSRGPEAGVVPGRLRTGKEQMWLIGGMNRKRLTDEDRCKGVEWSMRNAVAGH